MKASVAGRRGALVLALALPVAASEAGAGREQPPSVHLQALPLEHTWNSGDKVGLGGWPRRGASAELPWQPMVADGSVVLKCDLPSPNGFPLRPRRASRAL